MISARNSSTSVLAFAAFMVLAPLASGQAIDIPAIVTGTQGPNTWMGMDYSHQFRIKIDNSRAEMSRDSLQIFAGHKAEVGDDIFLVGNVAFQGTFYNFKLNRGPKILEWNDIHQTTLTLGVGWTVGEDWTLVALGMGRTAGESDSNFSDTLTGGGALAVDYRVSETLSVGAIVGALSQLEDHAAILPIPTVNWRFADNWRFTMGLVRMAYPGVGPEISYKSGEWEFAVAGAFQKRRYRLGSNTGPTSKGIGEETSFPIFARAAFTPNKYMNFGVMFGFSVGGKIRSGNASDSKIFGDDYSAAPFVGIQANFHF